MTEKLHSWTESPGEGLFHFEDFRTHCNEGPGPGREGGGQERKAVPTVRSPAVSPAVCQELVLMPLGSGFRPKPHLLDAVQLPHDDP